MEIMLACALVTTVLVVVTRFRVGRPRNRGGGLQGQAGNQQLALASAISAAVTYWAGWLGGVLPAEALGAALGAVALGALLPELASGAWSATKGATKGASQTATKLFWKALPVGLVLLLLSNPATQATGVQLLTIGIAIYSMRMMFKSAFGGGGKKKKGS